jgi:hypothetical protein
VWVTVTGSHTLVWFDALSVTPTAHAVALDPSSCGPVAIVDGGDGRMYFSMPNPGGGGCAAASQLASVDATAPAAVAALDARGTVYDLAVFAGKLYAPDFDGDVVRRISLGTALTVESATATPTGGGADGVAVDGSGRVWVTLYNAGGIAYFQSTQTDGYASGRAPGGPLSGPYGIVAAADGSVYVAGTGSATVARLLPDGDTRSIARAGIQPFQIVNGPDDDLYATDAGSARILHIVASGPRVSTGAATAIGLTKATVSASVDARGAPTYVNFEFGPTTAYGLSRGAVAVPAGAGAVPVSMVLDGLQSGTTYHMRAVALNDDGTSAGPDMTFTTKADWDLDGFSPPQDCNDLIPAAHPGAFDYPNDGVDQDCSGSDQTYRVLTAQAAFGWHLAGAKTRLTKVVISGLRGGEAAKLTCKGGGCPFKARTYAKLKKGTRSLTSLFGARHPLRAGAVVEIRVTKHGYAGTNARLSIRSRKDPKLARACVVPGSSTMWDC